MARPLQINLAVIFRVAAAGATQFTTQSNSRGKLRQRFRLGHVADERLDPGGFQFIFRQGISSQAENFMAEADQFRAQRQADVTAADNQSTHAIYD